MEGLEGRRGVGWVRSENEEASILSILNSRTWRGISPQKSLTRDTRTVRSAHNAEHMIH